MAGRALNSIALTNAFTGALHNRWVNYMYSDNEQYLCIRECFYEEYRQLIADYATDLVMSDVGGMTYYFYKESAFLTANDMPEEIGWDRGLIVAMKVADFENRGHTKYYVNPLWVDAITNVVFNEEYDD